MYGRNRKLQVIIIEIEFSWYATTFFKWHHFSSIATFVCIDQRQLQYVKFLYTM
jgi:hypothetical protein